MFPPLHFEQYIHTAPSRVWPHLITNTLIKKWMEGEDMVVEIKPFSKPGDDFIIKGVLHGHDFINWGKIEIMEFEKRLVVTHLSSLSELPDIKNNYSLLDFQINSQGSGTLLKLDIRNFPSFEIYKHLQFYWGPTLAVISRHVTEQI